MSPKVLMAVKMAKCAVNGRKKSRNNQTKKLKKERP